MTRCRGEWILPIILKNVHAAFRFGRQNALRSTSDMVDQLQKQIELLQFTMAEQRRQLDLLSREPLKAWGRAGRVGRKLARRDLRDALLSADSPSSMLH